MTDPPASLNKRLGNKQDGGGTAARQRSDIICLVATLLLGILLVGCDAVSDEPDALPLDLTTPWVVTTPEEAGIDPEGLAEALRAAEAIPRMMSLVVVRDGKLVLEEYFHGNHADSLNDVRSVTKSVIGTLVGVALAEGLIDHLDETIGDYLHPEVAVLNPDLQSISIRHLLTMTSGFAWDELNSDSYAAWIRSEDHLEHLLNQPLLSPPGSSFTYNSAAVHLLGVLLQEAVGMPLPAFADQYLFNPIGIHQSQWENLTRGYVNGGAGLDLRPRDLARLGQLYLQQGASGSTRLLPPDWTATSTVPQFEWRSSFGALRAFTYGHLWWLEEAGTEPAFFAWGYGGQFIYVVPALNTVIVTTTQWRGLSLEGGPEVLEQATLDIIINHLLPAIRESSPAVLPVLAH